MAAPAWKKATRRRYWAEKRGRRRRRDRREPGRASLFVRIICAVAGHDPLALGFRHHFRVRCRRCQDVL